MAGNFGGKFDLCEKKDFIQFNCVLYINYKIKRYTV